jgi:zinc D-Ala-D-Ala dipeptidase
MNLPENQRTLRCEHIATDAQFIALAQIAGIAVDLRYGTADNFVHSDVYSPLDCAWLHAHAAEKLHAAVTRLAQQSPHVRLLVLDALRPHRVQEMLWDSLAGTELHMYLADPAIGSLHSYGMAIDVTLIDDEGRELDMGTGFDNMTLLAHPELEAEHLAHGQLTFAQLANRLLLRNAMEHAGWRSISTEWWHFDATEDRAHIRATYTRVL